MQKKGWQQWGRLLGATLLWMSAGLVDLQGQAILNPNAIPVTLRLANSHPDALNYINGGSLPGMRAARIVARRNPPGTELMSSSDVSIFGAATKSFEMTVESDPAGYTYALGNLPAGAILSYVDFAPASGAVRYFLSSVNSGPVFPRPAVVAPVLIDVCVGVLVLRFPTGGSPFPITGGSVRVYSIGSGALQSEVTALSSGLSEAVVFVRGGEPVTVVVQYATGGDPDVDRIFFEDRFNVTIPCDAVSFHDVPRPTTAELGRIVGQLDMEGETETSARVIAINGPLGNRRTNVLAAPYYGAFELRNMVPSSLASPPQGYQAYAELNLQRAAWFGSFRSPTLGRGSNPSVMVSPGATRDLGETFAFRPGYVLGRLYLQGPPESLLGHPSALRGLVGSASAALQSHVFAQVNREETPSNVEGDAQATFGGGFFGDDTFDGSYRLAVAGLSKGGSIWNRAGVSLKLDSGTPAAPDSYVNQVLTISELINPRFRIPYAVDAGASITNDLNYALSKVIVDLDVIGGTLWNPALGTQSSGTFNTPNHGVDFQGNYRWYQAFLGAALGTPAAAAPRGQVVVYLPEGEYTLRPNASVANPGGGSARVEFPTIPSLRVGRFQCIRVGPCLRVEITNTLECAGIQGTPVRGRVLTLCTNPVTRIEWRTPNGATNVICEDCGLNPNFNFVLPTQTSCADFAFTLTAYDDAGRVTSIASTLARDVTPPAILCPTNLVVPCQVNSGASVNYTVTATDNCDSNPSLVCTPASGSFFPVGKTRVLCMAYDLCQNSAACVFTVQVLSNCPPTCLVWRCPTNVVLSCQSPDGAVGYYVADATNHCSAQPVELRCSPVSGSFFPVGTTEVTCVATTEDETRECQFNVIVLNDCQSNGCLTLSCPEFLVWNCSGVDGAQVIYEVVGSNRCASVDLQLKCSPPSGSMFRPGLTTVLCEAKGSGQIVRCQFPVIVVGARPSRGHTFGYRLLGEASLDLKDGAMQVRTSSSNSTGGVAFDLPGAASLSLTLSNISGAIQPAPGAVRELSVTDLNGNRVASLEFLCLGSDFVAKAAYPGLLNARSRIAALDTNGSLVELSNVTSLIVGATLGARVDVAASANRGVIISARYSSPIPIQVNHQAAIEVTSLIWSAEPASGASTSAVRLATCALRSRGFPPVIISDLTPVFEPMPTISGRIVDHRGRRVPGVNLYLSGVPEPAATTDAQGFFTVEIPAQCVGFNLTPIKPFHRFTPETVALPANAQNFEANFSALTPFRSWQAANWGTAALETIVGPQADPDGDKLPNILEYATGRNPTVADAFQPSPMTISLTNSGGRWLANLNINVADYATDLIAQIQASDSIGEPTWRTIDGPFPCAEPGKNCRVVPVGDPGAGGAGMFFRMELLCNDCVPTLPPPPSGSDHFRLAYYNTQTLPSIPGIAGDLSTTSGCCEDIPGRLERLGDRLAQAEVDVVGLAEVFGVLTGGAPRRLANQMRDSGYLNFVEYVGGPPVEIPIPILPNPWIRGESGLMLFSRFEFQPLPPRFALRYRPEQFHLRAESGGRRFFDVGFVQFTASSGNDAFSRKGAGLVRIRHPRSQRIFTVVFTHLQNGTSPREILVRESQLGQIKAMIETLLAELREDPTTRAEDTQVMLVGDLNINGDPRLPECLDGSREWENLFGTGVNSSVVGDFFKTTLLDVWPRQNKHVTAPVDLDFQDRGLTQSIHRSGGDPDGTCSLYVPPGANGRVDYLLMSGSAAAYPLQVQQMALAVNFRSDPPYLDAAIGSRGRQELSDHYGIIADINRRGPNATPQQAEILEIPPTGNTSQLFSRAGRLDHPGSMRWYRIDAPGTYDLAVLSALDNGPTFEVRAFDTRCLSIPIRPVAGLRRTYRHDGRTVISETFDLPGGSVLIRVSNPDENVFGSPRGDYQLLVRKREGIGQDDAIVLGPNRGPFSVESPNTFASSVTRWYLVNTIGAFSGRAQRMRFYLRPHDRRARYGLTLDNRFGPGGRLREAGPEQADSATGEVGLEYAHRGAGNFYLAVTAYAPTPGEGHAYDIGWNNNLTVIHRFYPAHTPGPIVPSEVQCLTQVRDDLQVYTDPILGLIPVSVETTADDLNVHFDIGVGSVFRHTDFLNPYLLSSRFDGGQAVALREQPFAFLDDEQAVVEVIVNGPARRGLNVLRGYINPLPANASTYGPETTLLERGAAPLNLRGKYIFTFYRTHGIPSGYEP